MAKKKRIVMIGGLMVTVIVIIAGIFYQGGKYNGANL